MLLEDVGFLVQSLGGVIRRGKDKIVKGKTYYRCKLSLPARYNPFRLPRKADRFHKTLDPVRTIVKIEKIGEAECQCISVDSPAHRYLTNECIVTHNTGWMVGGLAFNLLSRGKRVMYFTLDVGEREIITRMAARMTGISLDSNAPREDLRRAAFAWYERNGVDPTAFEVQHYPAHSKTVAQLKYKFRQSVALHGPVDAVFVDYGQLIKASNRYDKKYDSVGETFHEMQGWAKEDNFVLYTAAQVNRKGYDEEIITPKNISEGFNMMWPAQLAFSINQTRDERKANDTWTPMRIALLKNTKGRSQVVFPFSVSWETMEFKDTEGEVVDITEAPKRVRGDGDGEGRRRKQKPEDGDKALIRRRQDWKPRADDDMDIRGGDNE